eukprot:12926270-Prorocentrum_lima.AAC.1
MDTDQDGYLDRSQAHEMIRKHAFYYMQSGRYYVVLSLFEAEAIRGVIHMRQSKPLLDPVLSTRGESFVPRASISLRTPTSFLDGSSGYVPAYLYQQTTAEQC